MTRAKKLLRSGDEVLGRIRMKSTIRMMLATAAMTVAGVVGGQNFPSRAVTLTVGFASGGGADTVARLTEEEKVLTQEIAHFRSLSPTKTTRIGRHDPEAFDPYISRN